MRQKRTKQYKRLMALYSASFGFREPYQIIVDGDFMRTALRYKMDISRQLCTVMLGNTKQLYTSCTLSEVKEQENDEFGTAAALKEFERRGCTHRHKPISSAECISSIIGSDNLHNYCVATQNESLRERFRGIPGVPLLYINRTVLIIEPPSYATLQKAKQIENAKTHASVEELSFLTKVNPKKQTEAEKPKKKRKGPRQPNPLSCKKKKVKIMPQEIESKKKVIEVETKEQIHKNPNREVTSEVDNDSQCYPQENDGEPLTQNNNQPNKEKRKRKRKKSKKAKETGNVSTNNIKDGSGSEKQ